MNNRSWKKSENKRRKNLVSQQKGVCTKLIIRLFRILDSKSWNRRQTLQCCCNHKRNYIIEVTVCEILGHSLPMRKAWICKNWRAKWTVIPDPRGLWRNLSHSIAKFNYKDEWIGRYECLWGFCGMYYDVLHIIRGEGSEILTDVWRRSWIRMVNVAHVRESNLKLCGGMRNFLFSYGRCIAVIQLLGLTGGEKFVKKNDPLKIFYQRHHTCDCKYSQNWTYWTDLSAW